MHGGDPERKKYQFWDVAVLGTGAGGGAICEVWRTMREGIELQMNEQ